MTWAAKVRKWAMTLLCHMKESEYQEFMEILNRRRPLIQNTQLNEFGRFVMVPRSSFKEIRLFGYKGKAS